MFSAKDHFSKIMKTKYFSVAHVVLMSLLLKLLGKVLNAKISKGGDLSLDKLLLIKVVKSLNLKYLVSLSCSSIKVKDTFFK